MQGTHQWQRSSSPFTQPITGHDPTSTRAASPGLADLLGTLGSAQRGLLVVAELTTAEDVMAALALSKFLGWPVVADALSGGLASHLLKHADVTSITQLEYCCESG